MAKKENIVRYSSEQLKNMPSETDWTSVAAMSDQDIEQAIGEDPDLAPILDEEFFKTAEVIRSSDQKKRRITILVEEEVIAFFQKEGKSGYQRRMHDVLKAYSRHQSA